MSLIMKEKGRRTPANMVKRIMAALSKKKDELRTQIMIFFLLHRNSSGFLMDKVRAINSSSQFHGQKRHKNYDANTNFYDYAQQGKEEDDHNKAGFVMYVNKERLTSADDVDVPRKVFAYAATQENPPYQLISSGMVDTTEEEEEEVGENEDMHDLTDTLSKLSQEEMNQTAEFPKENSAHQLLVSTPSAVDDYGDTVDEEEDIDQAADLFIQRFKTQIQLQKQLSLDKNNTHSSLLQMV